MGTKFIYVSAKQMTHQRGSSCIISIIKKYLRKVKCNMQQKLNPDFDSTIELHEQTTIRGVTIHVFSFEDNTWYFVGELDKAFNTYTFKHFVANRQNKAFCMYVKIDESMTNAKVIDGVHIKTLNAIRQGKEQLSKSYQTRIRQLGNMKIIGGRTHRVVISEAGVIKALNNSHHRAQMFQALGIAVSEQTMLQQNEVALSMSTRKQITMNVTGEKGNVSIQIARDNFPEEVRIKIMSAIQDIVYEIY